MNFRRTRRSLLAEEAERSGVRDLGFGFRDLGFRVWGLGQSVGVLAKLGELASDA